MAELLTDKSRNLENQTTGHVRHKVHHNLPRRNTVHIDEPLNERRQMQRTVDKDGSSKTADVVNTQTGAENHRSSYADIKS